jgi:hypothetical protein
MIYQTKTTEFGEFCRYFFENLNFGQILSENLTEKHRNSRISPISLRTGKKPKLKSKSLCRSTPVALEAVEIDLPTIVSSLTETGTKTNLFQAKGQT